MSIDLSLDRLHCLVPHLPKYTRPTIHIAGTNGKGSVSAILSSIFISALPPPRVGRYNSPHLVSIYDCISLNDKPVEPEVYHIHRKAVEKANQDHGTQLSNFELLTVTALQIFEAAQVDVVILEVGMGGRLDATNVISDDCILASALTSVDLDHQSFLGNTVEGIAQQKAGIARKGKPFIVGRQHHPEVLPVVEAVIKEVGAILYPALVIQRFSKGESTTPAHPSSSASNDSSNFRRPSPQIVQVSATPSSQPSQLSLPLHGDHQLDNLGIALGIIEVVRNHPFDFQITPKTISDGVSSVSWPGRLSFHTISLSQSSSPLTILVDGAHNPASAQTLSTYLTSLLSLNSLKSAHQPNNINLTYILALSHSPPKTPQQTLSCLLPPRISSPPNITVKVSIAVLPFSPPEGMPWVKPISPTDLADVARGLVPDADIWVASKSTTEDTSLLRQALDWAADRKRCFGFSTPNCDEGVADLVVLAGSLYLVADFYRLLEDVET